MKKKSTLFGGKLLLMCFVFFQQFTSSAQFVAKQVIASNGQTVAFLQYKPATHDATGPSRRYPMIIFLHGGGESSTNPSLTPAPPSSPTSPVWKLRAFGPNDEISWGHRMNFTWNGKTDTIIVLQPMARVTSTWPTQFVDAMINYGIDSLKADTNRIYLTGHSYGGAGVFNYLNSSSANVKKLAAAAPVSCWNIQLNANGAGYVSGAKLPVWGFHAKDDTITDPNMTINSINLLNSVNPQVKPLSTYWDTGVVQTNAHHSAPEYVYNLHQHPYLENGVINIYEWFLGQNNDSLPNVLPVARAGNDTTISKTSGNAHLNGSSSTDADGKIVRYVWRKISGPAGGTILNAFGPNSSTTVSGLTTVGIYQYQLNVVDHRAAIARDTIKITVVNDSTGSGKAIKTSAPSGRVYTNTDVTQLTSASKFTLEAQIKIDSTVSGWSTIMRKGYNGTNRIMFHVGPGDNSIHCIIGSGVNAYGKTGANAVTPGNWYHLAFVYDGTQTGNANRVKLYIDGVQQTLDFDGTTIPATTSSLLSGQAFMAGADLTYGTISYIDEVRVWSTALAGTTINNWKNKSLGSCHPDISNLVVYWPLDNDANPAAAPAGLGTAFNGVVTNSSYVNTTLAKDTVPCPVAGSGKAIKTSAPSGRVYTNTDVTQLTSASKFTLEAQIKIDSTVSGWSTIMRKGYNGTNRIMFHVGPGDNSIHCIIGSGVNAYGKTGANAVTPGNWYHLAFVYDGTQTGNANRVKLYIDGVQQTLDFDGTTIPATTSSLLSGQAFMAGADLTYGTISYIDEVRVWSTALAGTTINNWKNKSLGSCHPDISNLVVYWPLDNDANPAAAPAGLGTAFNGVVTNSSYVNTTLAKDTVPCPGKAVHTTASAGRVYTNTDVTQLTSASKFTLEAQIKIDSTVSGWSTIMRKGYNGTNRIMFHIGPGDNSIHCIIGSGVNAYGKTGANAVAPGNWYHLAFVYDGTQTGNANRVKLYIDGVQQTLDFDGTTIPATTSSLLSGQAFMAGADLSYGNISYIDEVRVWSTALADTTINNWKNKSLGSCHPDISNLVVYWPLDNDANPTVSPAGLGTTYSGYLTNASYVSSTQSTSISGCSGSSLVLEDYPEEVKERPFLSGKLYPNPTQGSVQLELNATGSRSVTVNVIDMQGRYVYRKQTPVVKGVNRLTLDISSLHSGNYLIDIRDGAVTLEKYRVVKQ